MSMCLGQISRLPNKMLTFHYPEIAHAMCLGRSLMWYKEIFFRRCPQFSRQLFQAFEYARDQGGGEGHHLHGRDQP